MCSPENSTCLFSFHVCCPFSASGSLCLTGCGSRMWSRLHLGDRSGLCDGEWTEEEQHWAQEVGRLASLGFQEEGSIGTACLLGTWEAQLHRIRHQVTLSFSGFFQCLEEVIPPEQTSLLTCVLHPSCLQGSCLSYTAFFAGSNWHVHFLSGGRPPPSHVFFLLNLQFSFPSYMLSHVRLFATPWTAACQASLSITNSWSLLKLMSIESVMPSSHLILCHPLLFLPSIFPSIRVFSSESVVCIRWPKYWSFSFSISPSNEYSGLISLRMD